MEACNTSKVEQIKAQYGNSFQQPMHLSNNKKCKNTTSKEDEMHVG